MSSALASLVEQRMDLTGKSWVLCKCNHSIVAIAHKVCMICETPFAESWDHHKTMFEKQAIIEKDAIEAMSKSDEGENDDDTKLVFPEGTSYSVTKFFKDHIQHAFNTNEPTWASHIRDKGLGNTVQETIEPFKDLYDSLASTRAKGDLLNKVRDAEDNEMKIKEFALILLEAEEHANA